MLSQLRWNKVIRGFWQHKARSALVVLAIAIGVALIGIILTAREVTIREMVTGFEANNAPHVKLYMAPFHDDVLPVVRALPEVDEVEARYTQALARWEQQQIQAESRLEQAQVAVARIETQIADATLVAPFEGTISDVSVKVGDTVASGQAIATLAALAQLRARTKDMTELDVVRLHEGQAVTVAADALPEAKLSGTIARIELHAEDYRGDVVYPVYIDLDTVPPELRWGMTVLVEIVEE